MANPITKKRQKELLDWCERHITIKHVVTGKQSPLRWNESQKLIFDQSDALRFHHVTDGTVKMRQGGISTGLLCYCIALIVHFDNICITWVNLDEDVGKVIRRKFEALWQSAQLSPGSGVPEFAHRDSEQEFVLPNGSAIVWEAAGGSPQTAGRAGRGDTIDLAIYCEMATWEYADKTLAAIRPAIKSTKGGTFIDSTPPEFEGDGAEYLSHIRAIRSGNFPGEVIFLPWWLREDYYADTPAEPPYGIEERALMRAGIDLYRIQWRRETIADPSIGDRFPRIYPESLDVALTPEGQSAFDAHILDALKGALAADDWPMHLSRAAVRDLTGCDNTSLLTNDTQCRIYDTPTQVDTPDNIKGRVMERSRLGHILAVDASDGGPKSDNQGVALIDPHGDIIAMIRVRTTPMHLAAAVQRLALAFDATVVIESNARAAALVERYVREPISEEEIARHGCDSMLAQPYVKVFTLHANVKTRVAIEDAFVTHLNGLVECPNPWLAAEMLAWDAEKRKARAGSVDDLLDACGIAWYFRNRKALKTNRKLPRRSQVRRVHTAF